MPDALFITMDIPKETRKLLDSVTEAHTVTEGMTDSELKAYQMGIGNTLSALEAVLESDDERVVHMDGTDIPTEMDFYEIVDPDVEQVYQGFWKDIICNEDGSINMEQLKKELYDCHRMIDNVPIVYSEVTGGTLSYPTYKADTVVDIFREKYYDKAWAVDLLADDWVHITADCETNEDYKKAVFDYLGTEE